MLTNYFQEHYRSLNTFVSRLAYVDTPQCVVQRFAYLPRKNYSDIYQDQQISATLHILQ